MNRVLELANHGDSLANAIEKMLGTNIYPTKPQKPKLPNNYPSREEYKIYDDLREIYDVELLDFVIKKEAYQKKTEELQAEIKEAIWEDTGLNFIPEQYREKVWNLAWNEKHSHGYADVISFLYNLVEVFQ